MLKIEKQVETREETENIFTVDHFLGGFSKFGQKLGSKFTKQKNGEKFTFSAITFLFEPLQKWQIPFWNALVCNISNKISANCNFEKAKIKGKRMGCARFLRIICCVLFQKMLFHQLRLC